MAVASTQQTVCSSLFQFHGLRLCASPVVSRRSTSGIQTLLSTWILQQRLTKNSCHRFCCARTVQRGDSVFLASRSCVTIFPHQLEWETSHTVAGSNIDDLGFTYTRYNFDVRSLGEPAQKSRSKPCSRTDIFSSWLSDKTVAVSTPMALRFGPQIFRKFIVLRGLNSAGFTVSTTSIP